MTAFRATLEELEEADILIHVVDLSARDAADQCQAVEDILEELGVTDKPRITALNKIDLLLDGSRRWTEEEALGFLSGQPAPTEKDTVLVSAGKKWGLLKIRETIARILSENGTYYPNRKNGAL